MNYRRPSSFLPALGLALCVAGTPTLLGAQGLPLLNLQRTWEHFIWGTSLGETGMVPVDLDGDGTLEIVLGASSRDNFWDNDSWHVARYVEATDEYAIVWSSETLSVDMSRIVVVPIGGVQKVLVGREDGRLMVYDGATRELEGEHAVATDDVRDIILGDADNDGALEVVIVTDDVTHLLDPGSWTEQLQIPLGARDAALGNVDGDAALELVLATGPIVEATTTTWTVDWDFSLFWAGWLVEVSDVDDDGIDEVVSARSWEYVDVYDVDLESPKYNFYGDRDIDALLLADVTGDGKAEILFGEGQRGKIYALDAADGTLLWDVDNPESGTTYLGVADTDADGTLELFWGGGQGSTGQDYFYVYDVPTRSPEFQSDDLVGPFQAVSMGDADDDGGDEIVAFSSESERGFRDGVGHVFDAATFALEWKGPTDLFERRASDGIHDVAIGDPDDDGQTELVVATDWSRNGAIYVIDGATKTIEAQYIYDRGSPMHAVALADIDADGQTEIIAGGGKANTGSPGVFAYVIDGATGAVEWQRLLDTGWPDVWGMQVADVRGDATPEIVVTLDNLYVVAGDGTTIAKTWESGFRGLAVGSPTLGGPTGLWLGTTGGDLVRYDPASLTETARSTVCAGELNAIALDTASALTGSIQLACDDDVAIYDPGADTIIWRSPPIGPFVGFQNNLVVTDAPGGQAMLVAGTGRRIVAFEGLGTTSPDLDGDEVPNTEDNCPELANPDQADADADGAGDACDSDTSPGSLAIDHVRIRIANAANATNGSLRLRGQVDDSDSGGDLVGSLLSNGVTLRLTDPSGLDLPLALDGCAARGRRVRCRTSPGTRPNVKAVFRTRPAAPLLHRVTLGVRSLGRQATGEGLPTGPIEATLVQGLITRVGGATRCAATGARVLVCME